jgi:hypothetical protein
MAAPLHPINATLEMIKQLVQRRQDRLQEAQAALQVQLSKDKPTTRANLVNWQTANDTTQEEWSKAKKMLKDARDELADEEAKAEGGAAPPSFRYSKLPSHSLFPVFQPKLTTTRRDCTNFLDAYERTMNTAVVPYQEGPRGFEQQRWLAAIHQSFPRAKRSHELLDWLKGHTNSKITWKAFKAEFIAKFAKDKTLTQAKKKLENCKQQNHQDVGDFYDDFITFARDADFGGNEPPANWKQSNLLADKFLRKLKPTLIEKIVDDIGYEAVANDVVQLFDLAARVERAQAAKASVLQQIKSIHGGGATKSAKGKEAFTKRKPSKPSNGKFDKQANGQREPAIIMHCTRCKRSHRGGAKSCWSATFDDGSTIKTPATAAMPEWFEERVAKRNKNGGSKRAANIDPKAEKRSIKRRKKIGRMLNGRNASVTFLNEDNGSNSLNDEFENSFDEDAAETSASSQ